jgi:hypothetical protein
MKYIALFDDGERFEMREPLLIIERPPVLTPFAFFKTEACSTIHQPPPSRRFSKTEHSLVLQDEICFYYKEIS